MCLFLLQDPFDPNEFVERLAWRATGGLTGRTKPEDFDPMELHKSFEKTIKDLKDLNVRMQRKVERLETECKEEEKSHWSRVGNLQKDNQVNRAISLFDLINQTYFIDESECYGFIFFRLPSHTSVAWMNESTL